MAKTYQTTLLIRGDSKNAVREVSLTRDELEKLTGAQMKAGMQAQTFGQTLTQSLKGGKERFTEVATVATKWGLAVAGAAATAGAAMVRSGLESVDSLAKTSDKLGIATEELAKLRFAAEQTGVSSNTLDMALQRMTRRVAEAGQGTGEAVKALEELGLNAQELANMSPDQIFREVTRAMEGVDSQSDKVRLAFKLFDSEGVALVNTLNAGVDGLDSFGTQAEKLGIAVTRDMARKVEEANDSINEVQNVIKGFAAEMAVEFAPDIVEAMQSIRDAFSDPENRRAVAEFVSNGKAVIDWGVETAQVMGFLVDEVKAFFGVIGEDDYVRNLEKAANLRKAIQTAEESWLPWVKARAEDYREELAVIEKNMAAYEKRLLSTLESERDAEIWSIDMGEFFKFVGTSASDMVDDVEDAASIFDSVMGDLGMSSSAMAGTVTQSHQDVMAMIDEFAGATEASAVTAETANKAIGNSTDEMSVIVNRGFERMRDGVGDFFQKMLVDGKASFSDLADMFKRVIAEMIATAASNRIMVALGLTGGSSAASAAVSGLSSGVSGALMGSLGGASVMGGGFLANGVTNMMGNFAQTGAGALNSLGISGFGQTSATLVGGGLNLGAGIVGGIGGTKLGESLFGRTANSSIGATIGGVAGTALGGPIGALIGSALGGLADAAFGSSNSDKWVNYDFANGQSTLTRDTGKPLSMDAANAGVAIVQQLSDLIGPSSARFEISGGRKSGLRLDGQVFGDDLEAFAKAAFDELVAGSERFSDTVKGLARNFKGTTDEALAFTNAWASIEEQLGQNPVDSAIADFTRLQDAAANTFLDGFNSIADATRQLAADYDGTAISASNLAQGLQSTQQAAYEMSLAILAMDDQMRKAAGDSAESIREVVMSEEERRRAWLTQRDSLRATLEELTDPQKITETANEILNLNRRIFDSFGDDYQKTVAEDYARVAENVGDVASRQYDEALSDVQRTQEDVAARVSAILEGAAAQQQAAATDFASGVQSFLDAVARFGQGQDIRVSVRNEVFEVNAS